MAKDLGQPEFTNLSNVQNLNFLEGMSPKELLDQIMQIRNTPLKIHAIYWDGKRHIAWIQGNFKKK